MSTPASTITMVRGDIFSAPSGSVLLHACNARGRWGAGIAKAFRERYPAAYKIYQVHCVDAIALHRDLRGTCLLIAPQRDDVVANQIEHWVACLFTSKDYGFRRDRQDVVLRSTEMALKDLVRQVEEQRASEATRAKPGQWHSAKLNAGKFGVPWHRTKPLVEELGVEVTAYEFDERAES